MKKFLPWIMIALVSLVWGSAGFMYGYQTRDSDLYSRGYQNGQEDMYKVYMIRVRSMEKEIDALKGRK